MVGALGSRGNSLAALRYLGDATSALSKVYQRLSSGSRINSAADDAAGIAIADQLRAGAKTLSVASRNVSDGLSAVAIAAAGLDQQTSILVRLRELAEQSANGTLSSSQRETVNKEYLTLMREFTRVADTTKFNKQKLLGGLRQNGTSSMWIQAGTTGSSSGNISYLNPDTGSLAGYVNTDTMEHVIDGGADWGDFTSGGSRSLSDILARFPNAVFTKKKGVGDDTTTDLVVFMGIDTGTVSTGALGIASYRLNEATGLYDIDNPGGLFGLNASDSSRIAGAALDAAFTYLGIDLAATRFVSSSQTGQNLSVLEFSGVESAARAKAAISILQTKFDSLALDRSKLGAVESRLNAAASVLLSSQENTVAAEGRIRDVDVASESSLLIRNQILQQSSSSILHIANQNQELALQLLKF